MLKTHEYCLSGFRFVDIESLKIVLTVVGVVAVPMYPVRES